MKIHFLFFALLVYCAAPLNAQDTLSDSTKIDTSHKPVKKKVSVSVGFGENRYGIRWSLLDIGISTYLYDGNFNLPQSLDVYELNYSRSYHINFRLLEQRINFDKKGHVSISQGLNFEWQNYNFVNDYVFQPSQPVVTPVLSEKKFSKNRLLTSLVSLPVELHIESNPKHLKHSFHLSGGVVGGFLYGANQKTKLDDNGDKNKVCDDFNLNKFRIGWIGRIGYGPVNFYVSNSITPLFKKGQGPELIPLQIGVALVPF